jgi:tetratricopeptide (TPR) repeat protein
MKLPPDDQERNEIKPLDLMRLLEDAIGHIVKQENFIAFKSWLLDNVVSYQTMDAIKAGLTEKELQEMAKGLLRPIWNATPLPGNQFKPRPLPKPKRNEICYCGSGRKFKRCCQDVVEAPELPAEYIWHLALQHLDMDEVQDAIRKKWIPPQALILLQDHYWDEGKPKKALQVIEPVFFPTILHTDDAACRLFDELLDLYGELGYTKKKERLIEHILEHAPRSPLRCDVLLHQATIFMDRKDPEAAWSNFQQAMRENPDSLTLGVTEIHLLVAEGDTEKAKDRARFWLTKHSRDPRLHDSELLEYLRKSAEDPQSAISDIALKYADIPEGFTSMLQTATERPIPAYTYGMIEPLDLDASGADEIPKSMDMMLHMSKMLRKQGINGQEIERFTEELREQFASGILSEQQKPAADATGAPDGAPSSHEDDYCLNPPEHILAIEDEWYDIFPLEKPFGTQFTPFDAEGEWDDGEFEEWAAFLEQHPEAFDSLDILDDVVTALLSHPDIVSPSSFYLDSLFVPLLQRACMILHASVPAGGRLLWGYMDNRPALRALARLAGMLQAEDRLDEAVPLMQEYLALNPVDNHGLRAPLMNHYVASGALEEAVALSDNYLPDIHPEIMYGRVLALYRLGRLDEAREALTRAVEELPLALKFLVKAKVKKPKLSQNGIRIGGEDQAWLYREEMLDAWRAAPGALEWLKKNA